MRRNLPFFIVFSTLLVSCTSGINNNQVEPAVTATNTEDMTSIIPLSSLTATLFSPTPLPDFTPTPESWMDLPVIPEGVSLQMVEVYQRGLARGRDPNRFSKLGDCQNVTSFFLGIFDSGAYELGEEYATLQPTIDHFAGSWSRDSLAVKGGLNVAAVQTLYYTDPEHCDLNESPMVCEIRTNNPTIALISFETWWADKPASGYEDRLRAVVEYVLSQDVVPILATKADNLEGDNSINTVIVRVAEDYQVPLWNFWAAANPLPYHGLTVDGFHLTYAQNYFDDPRRMDMAWPWRNLTALQSIDAVYRALNNIP
jgi:hypothetical protein